MNRSVTICRGKTDGEGRVVFWSEFGVCADVFKNSAREGRRHRAARRRRPAPMKTTDLRYYIRVSEKTALYNICTINLGIFRLYAVLYYNITLNAARNKSLRDGSSFFLFLCWLIILAFIERSVPPTTTIRSSAIPRGIHKPEEFFICTHIHTHTHTQHSTRYSKNLEHAPCLLQTYILYMWLATIETCSFKNNKNADNMFWVAVCYIISLWTSASWIQISLKS